MDKFITAGKLPNFERLRRESETYLTEAGEEQENLEPWTQWVTVHSGLTYGEHGIRDLGDGYKLSQKSIWDLLSDAGKRVWVCGSMNVNYEASINGLRFTDRATSTGSWTHWESPIPPRLSPSWPRVPPRVRERGGRAAGRIRPLGGQARG